MYRLAAGLPAAVWTGPKVNDEAHPTLASDCADMLLRLARHDGTGIFHCFGSEWIGRVDLAHQIAAAFDADPALIAPTRTDQRVLDEMRHTASLPPAPALSARLQRWDGAPLMSPKGWRPSVKNGMHTGVESECK